MNGKQKKNAAVPHGVNAEAKVLAGIRWAHENDVLAVCAPVGHFEYTNQTQFVQFLLN
jgi:hypothetical protein